MRRRSGEGPQLSSTFAVGEEAEQTGAVIRGSRPCRRAHRCAATASSPATMVRVDVVVRTRKIGHFFPGGTVDAFDVWLELQGKDADREADLLERQGGGQRARGRWSRGAHFYRSYQLDGRRQHDQQAQCMVRRAAFLYVRLIPPGAADVAHFRVQIPKDAKGPITVTAQAELSQVHRTTITAVLPTPASRKPRSGSVARRQGSHDRASSASIRRTSPRTFPARSRSAFRTCRSSRWRGCEGTAVENQRQAHADWTPRGAERRTVSAGTTGASACSFRAISRAPNTHSRRSPKPNRNTPTAG